MGELGFVWERCEDKKETGSCEGARTRNEPQGDEPMLGPRFGLFGLLGRPSLDRKGRKARVGLESDSSFRSSERDREQIENQLLQKSSGHCRHLLLLGLTTALTTLWVGWGGEGQRAGGKE